MEARADAVLPRVTAKEQTLIERAESLGHGLLAANAASVDRGMLDVKVNISALVSAGLAGINVPSAYGGAEVGRTTEMLIVESLAYGDGTTPFVMVQHYGTSLMLAASSNEDLRRAMLPRMARGDVLTGFGISHVRRTGRPVLAAAPYGAGYRFDGAIPWLTGYGIFDFITIAGTLPAGRVVLAWIPLRETEHLRFSAPMELVAMNGANTVSATVDGLVVGSGDILDVQPNLLRGRPNAVAVPCLFGLARACVDDLSRLAAQRDAAASARAAERLAARLGDQRATFYAQVVGDRGVEDVAAVSRARASATRLALEAAGALIVATGGGANAVTHPAQRRLREASVFATWGLNSDAVDAAVTAFAEA